MKIDFKYAIDQEVLTVFGNNGVVSMLGHDDGGNVYFVKTAESNTWFKEKQLSAR